MGRKNDAFRGPGRRIVQQWLRHLEKVRDGVREARGERPALRLLIKAEDVSRFLTVSDGDGFVAAGLRIRLLGVDAPEIDQTCMDAQGGAWPCGKRARWRLFELLSGKELEVEVHDVDRYGRMLSVCRANGVDVAEVMVREGLAICYCSERYAQAQQEAMQARRGMWRGGFEEPASWRQRCWQQQVARTPENKPASLKRMPMRKKRMPARRVASSVRWQVTADGTPSGWEELFSSMHKLLGRLHPGRG